MQINALSRTARPFSVLCRGGVFLSDACEDSFSNKVSHNMVSNVARTALMAIVGLLMVPYYIGEFGLATYAILPLATTVTNYFAMISDSLSNAFSRYTVAAIQEGDRQGANRIFSTSVLGMGKCMAYMFVLSVIISYAAPCVFNVADASHSDVQIMFMLIMIASMIISFSSSLGSVYMAYNRLYITYWSRSLQTLSQVVLVVLFLAVLGPSLPMIGVSFLLSSLLMLAIMLFCLKKVDPELEFSRQLYDSKLLREMDGLGIWSILSEVGNLMFIQASLIVVNMMLGSHIQGTFSIAANVIMMIHTACTAISASAVPLLYRHHAKGNTDSLVDTLCLFSKFVGVTLAFPIAYLLVFMPQVIEVWLGAGYDDLYPMLLLMVPIEVTVCAVSAYVQVPIAYMRVRPVACATIFGGLFNIVASVILLSYTDVGVLGVCIAWVISMLLVKLGFYPFYCRKLTGRRLWTFLKPIIESNLVFVVVVVVLALIAHLVVLPTSWIWILSTLFVGFLVFFIITLKFLYNKSETSMILTFLPSSVKKIMQYRRTSNRM